MFAEHAHPADLPGRYADHQGEGRHILIDYSTCADEGVFTNGHAAYDGAVGTEGDAFLHQGVAILVFAFDQRARVVDVGEDHARAAEHAFLEGDVVVHRDVVLHLAAIADQDPVADEHVLAKGDALADARTAADVHEMPDARTFADLCAVVDDGAGVLVMVHGQTL
ncbi:hypothetical protein D3C85_1336970 [compost metagenome]